MSTRWTSIVLAGGKGTRMKSPLPKVLHPVAGQPMLARVLRAVKGGGVSESRVVVGYGETLVRQVVEPLGGLCYVQKEQRGTADAVRSADPESLKGFVLVMNGDHPLVSAEDIEELIKEFSQSSYSLAVVSAQLKRPGAFGRIIRHQGELHSIVEAKDASASTLKIPEVNTGIYLARAEVFHKYLPMIQNENAKREFYLTDLVGICREHQEPVGVIASSAHMAFGVNDQLQLAQATKVLFRRKIKALMAEGVVVIDPAATYVESTVSVGAGSVLYPGAYLRGQTSLGSFCVVEPNVFISDCEIHDSVQIRMGSHLERSVVKSKAVVGPYGRLRPDSTLEEEAQIGNFVELKKTTMKKGAKASHLTYLGDAEIGERTNIGCGTITCNYAVDRKKYKTTIGADVFVGSDSQFVAPVTIGDGAIVGSGSTITKDVPEKALAVARGKMFIKEDYQPKAVETRPNGVETAKD